MENRTISDSANGSVSALIIAIIMFLVSFFAPFSIILSQNMNSIDAVFWHLDWSDLGTSAMILQPYQWVLSLPITFLRFYFSFEMYRLYSGKSAVVRTLKIGILAEIPSLIYGIIAFVPVFFIPFYLYVMIVLPIPDLLLTGWVIIQLSPPSVEETHWTSARIE